MTDNQEDPTQDDPTPEDPTPEDPVPADPVFGETRMINVMRDGSPSVEIQVYTGKGWVTFDEMLSGKFSGGDEPE